MIVLPLDRLPESPMERHAALRDYFCDKDATAVLTSEGWALTLAWSDDGLRYVDPRLKEGMEWWEPGTKFSDMALASRRAGCVLSALYDTWTLLSWSEWLAKQELSHVSSVVILHVDDHRDLGSPRLFTEQGSWHDPITGKIVSLTNPESVYSAICSGAISMGSFLTPFLHTVPTAEVRHLCQPPKSERTQDFKVMLCEEPDHLLDLSAKRPAIQLIPIDGPVKPGGYRLTPNMNDWLEDIGERPVLLHIDMDYFCNRYDGDSDWVDCPPLLDLPLDKVLAKIDELTNALHRAGLCDRIEDVVIAYSPGFFPAELWSLASDRLLAGLGVKGCLSP